MAKEPPVGICEFVHQFALTDGASGPERFTRPTAVVQRRYELLRAYYVEELSAAEIAERFGCSQASVRTLISRHREADPGELFASPRPGPRRQPKKDAARARVNDYGKSSVVIAKIPHLVEDAIFSFGGLKRCDRASAVAGQLLGSSEAPTPNLG